VEDDKTIFGGPLHVTCECGLDFTGKDPMAQFRAHYSSGITQDTAPKPINTNQRTKRSRLR
jgi:hypothetical protein